MEPIVAVLDLEKAIGNFREEVESVLEIGEVREWDGVECLRRESQIVKAALI